MNESSFWTKLRKGLQNPPDTHLVRIENAIYSGTPDVSYCISAPFGSTEGFIELKYLKEWPKRAATIVRLPHFTRQQRTWLHDRHMAGGKCYLCLGVKKSLFLIDGLQAAMYLGKNWRKVDIYDNSLIYFDGGKVDWTKFKMALMK